MSYIDNEILERLIGTMIEGFARIEKKLDQMNRNEILERLIGTMVEGFARIEKKLDQMNRLKECMNGDRLLDNVDLAELLGVSQRTLARYRQEGKIKYYSVEKNGKSFYLASEIQSFLLQRGKNVVNNK